MRELNNNHKPVKLLGDKLYKRSVFENLLLNSLPNAEIERLYPFLELVYIPFDTVLYEYGSEIPDAYFPTNSIITLQYSMDNGTSSAVTLIGNEGVVGQTLFMNGSILPNRGLVQSSGYAYRINKQVLVKELIRYSNQLQPLISYSEALVHQMSQTAYCNTHHGLEQRFCWWLLCWLDRLGADQLDITQELISNMLPERRGDIVETALTLHQAALIKYRRGHISVLNRPGLEARVCGCYRTVKNGFDNLLPVHAGQEILKSKFIKVPSLKSRRRIKRLRQKQAIS